MRGWQVCVGIVVVTLGIVVIQRDRRGEGGESAAEKMIYPVYIHRIYLSSSCAILCFVLV